MSSIADIRKDYKLRELLEADMSPDPFQQFEKWWQEVITAEITESNAMTLATVSGDGTPSARIVLLKGLDKDGFLFFTNYNSQKAKDLSANPKASLVFFWKELERQVRVNGEVERVEEESSDAYFNSRPEASRVGAWSSPQSTKIDSREWLQQEVEAYSKRFESNPLVRPAFWGGYRVKPQSVEFWQGRPNRLHDRLKYQWIDNKWKIDRLAP